MSRQDPALREPPADLSGFPSWDLTTDRRLYRAHGVGKGPVWFASAPEQVDDGADVGGRFDLPFPMGTCYLGASAEVAVRERWGPKIVGRGVSRALVDDTVVTRMSVTTDVRLADACSGRAAAYGAHRELGTTVPYARPQRWAAAFHERLGRLGIRYWSRFSSGRRDWAFALFAGHGSEFPPDAQPLREHSRHSGAEAARAAGVQIIDTPRRVAVSPPPRRRPRA